MTGRTGRTARCALMLLPIVGACATETKPDAHGNLEAEEVLVSAQSSGQLEQFAVREGARVDAGETVAVVDTIQLTLERELLLAQRRAMSFQRDEMQRQQASIRAQREIAQRGLDRTLRLLQGGAATAVQRDQQERDTRVLTEQERAAALSLERLDAEMEAIAARLAALADRTRRARVQNPVPGTVLVTFVRAGEIVQPGQPLYRVADLDTLTVRAYVSGQQLASFRLGDTVNVHTDAADGGLTTHRGQISWVSSRAEFTPTPVQTRDDRADLVYAVKIRVPNTSGALKIGMPADVTLSRVEAGK